MSKTGDDDDVAMEVDTGCSVGGIVLWTLDSLPREVGAQIVAALDAKSALRLLSTCRDIRSWAHLLRGGDEYPIGEMWHPRYGGAWLSWGCGGRTVTAAALGRSPFAQVWAAGFAKVCVSCCIGGSIPASLFVDGGRVAGDRRIVPHEGGIEQGLRVLNGQIHTVDIGVRRPKLVAHGVRTLQIECDPERMTGNGEDDGQDADTADEDQASKNNADGGMSYVCRAFPNVRRLHVGVMYATAPGGGGTLRLPWMLDEALVRGPGVLYGQNLGVRGLVFGKALRWLCVDCLDSLTTIAYADDGTPSLEHLRLDECARIETLPSPLPALRTLRIRGTAFVVPGGMFDVDAWLAKGSAPVLETLVLDEMDCLAALRAASVSRVHSLRLERCTYLHVVATLAEARTVCVKDCSALRWFPDTPKATDVCVKGCRALRWFGIGRGTGVSLPPSVSAPSPLQCVTYFRLEGCDTLMYVPDLPCARTVRIEDCGAIESVGAMGHATHVTVRRCRMLTVVGSMERVEHLVMAVCCVLEHLPPLPRAQVVELINCWELTRVPDLPVAHKVVLRACNMVLIMGALPRAVTVSISTCAVLERVPDLPVAAELNVACCSVMRNIGALPWAFVVTIHGCGALASVGDMPRVRALDMYRVGNRGFTHMGVYSTRGVRFGMVGALGDMSGRGADSPEWGDSGTFGRWGFFADDADVGDSDDDPDDPDDAVWIQKRDLVAKSVEMRLASERAPEVEQ